jgi:hypothetical protein
MFPPFSEAARSPAGPVRSRHRAVDIAYPHAHGNETGNPASGRIAEQSSAILVV